MHGGPCGLDRLPRAVPYVALITGASAGIGEATARRLAREPDTQLVLVARREEKLQALADELGGATTIAVDLTDDDAPQRVRDTVERKHGELHLLVNNAGAAWRGHVRRDRLGEHRAPHEARLRGAGSADRGAAAAAAANRGDRICVGDNDPKRVAIVNVAEHGQPRLATEIRRVLGRQVRALRLERRALRRGGRARRSRRSGAARVRQDRGLPGHGATRQAPHPMARLARRNGWPRRSSRPAREGRPSATCPDRTTWRRWLGSCSRARFAARFAAARSRPRPRPERLRRAAKLHLCNKVFEEQFR